MPFEPFSYAQAIGGAEEIRGLRSRNALFDTQRAAMAEDQKRNALIRDAQARAMQGDPNALNELRSYDPMSAMQFEQQLGARELEALTVLNRAAQATAASENPGIMARFHLSSPAVKRAAQAVGFDIEAALAGERSDDDYKAGAAQLAEITGSMLAPKDPGELVPVQGANGPVYQSRENALGQLVPSNALGSETPSNVREFEYFAQLSPADQERYLNVKRASSVQMIGGVPTQVSPSAALTPLSTPQAEDLATARKAGATETGRAQAEMAARLPQIEQASEVALATLKQLKEHPGKAYAIGKSSLLPIVPGSDAADFMAILEQASGQVFLQAFAALKGAGAITEREGEKGEQASGRIRQRNQSEPGYDKAIDDLVAVIESGLERARRNAGTRSAAPSVGGDVAPSTALELPEGWTLRPLR